jgi:hypothetical protein
VLEGGLKARLPPVFDQRLVGWGNRKHLVPRLLGLNTVGGPVGALAPPEISIDAKRGLSTLSVGSNALDNGGKAHICLVQLAASTVDAIKTDASRPEAVKALADLLGQGLSGSCILDELAPGGVPVVVVTPEYAFGGADWGAIDELVRTCSRPLILIAGFGASNGSSVVAWRDAAVTTETDRLFSWDQNSAPIASARPLNGSWTWIHRFQDRTVCVVSIKNFLEQSLEAVALPNLQVGQQILHLKFNDLDLFPLICADLLQSSQTAGSAQARVHQAVAGHALDKRVMVVGCLLQKGHNSNWPIAIADVLNGALSERRGVVVLANVATNTYEAVETADKWRSISGVYTRYTFLPKSQKHLPAGRAIVEHSVSGAVVRDTGPSVVSGPVVWPPYNPIDGQFLWHTDASVSIAAQGVKKPLREPPSIGGTELRRFSLRYPPKSDWCPRLNTGLEEMRTHVCEMSPVPSGERILSTLLKGVDAEQADPDALHSAEIVSALKVGLHAMAILKTAPNLTWQANREFEGQLEGPDKAFLVWRDPEKSPPELLNALRTWKMKLGDHPPLVVFGQGPFGSAMDQKIDLRRRDDFPSPPASTDDVSAGGSLQAAPSDITQPKHQRNVVYLKLDHLSEVYLNHDPDNPKDAERLTNALKLANDTF